MRASLVAVSVAAALAVPPIAVAAAGAPQIRHVPGPRAGAVVEVRGGTAEVTGVVPGLAALGTTPTLADVAAAWRSELRWMGGGEASVEAEDGQDRPYGWVAGVGDLDGDRRRDIVGVRTDGETLTYRGIKGSTGKVLWRHREPGAFGDAVPARVGADSQRGVLLLSVAFEMTEEGDGTGTITSTTTVTALSGSGNVLWRRSFEGSGTMSDMGAVIEGLAFPAGVGRLNEGRTSDVVIASTDMAAGPLGGAERMQLFVLDGATGDTTMTTESPNAGGFSSVGLVGDLDGDGLQDLVTAATASAGGVSATAYRGADGRPLWSSVIDAEFVYEVADGGDLDGDGTADLLLTGFSPDSFGGTVTALSGAGGTALWTANADVAVAVGDLNGDHADDVMLQRIIDSFSSGRMGIRYVARRGDGTRLFSRAYTVRMAEGSSSATMIALYGDVGDANGDRRPDLAHEVEHIAFEAGETRTNRGVVRSSDGVKTMRGRVGTPLMAKVDRRRGHDFAVTRDRPAGLEVRIRDGRTGKLRWRRLLSSGGDSFAPIIAVNVAGDRRAEVFATVNGGRVPRIYALNPRTGRLRWRG